MAGINEYRMRRKDGRPAWLGISSVPVMDAGGAYLGVTGFVRDIGEQKRCEEIGAHKLRLLRRKFVPYAALAPMALIITAF